MCWVHCVIRGKTLQATTCAHLRRAYHLQLNRVDCGGTEGDQLHLRDDAKQSDRTIRSIVLSIAG